VLDLFRQATTSALALLGEGAFLRGTVACRVNVEDGVQFAGLDTEFEATRESRNAVMTRTLATISTEYSPKVGDTLAIGARNYILDVMVEDAGPFRRFVLLKV
jgi:3-deoxy-D-arabino-heptulosonate 7-phosphate (DAHP) synthase